MHVRFLLFILLIAAAGVVPVARGDAPADVAAVQARVKSIPGGTCVVDGEGRLTEIVLPDGSSLATADAEAFGRLPDLVKLQVFNCRAFDDAMVASIAGLRGLRSLALTNTLVTDDGVATIAASFPDLVELDLSSNTMLSGGAMKAIATLGRLEKLSLMQTRLNDLQLRRLSKLANLEVLDLRGAMEAGDMTLGVVGKLPKLRALKHRSTVVSDAGLEKLAASGTLQALLIQDFAITNDSGRHLAAIPSLESLEIFRCQGFGTEGVLALAPLDKLARLTLRDLPEVGDPALAVLVELPAVERLSLHELASVGDEGLAHLAKAGSLEILDIWSLPKMTDATVAVIAGLPNLRELSIRETGVTEACLDAIAGMPKLESLTFKNGAVSPERAAKLAAKRLRKLDLGR